MTDYEIDMMLHAYAYEIVVGAWGGERFDPEWDIENLRHYEGTHREAY